MRKLLFLAAIAACGPGDRFETPDANSLPSGIWEPDPGAGRAFLRAAPTADGVWFAYRRIPFTTEPDGWWLTKTSTDGQPIVAPVQIDPDSNFPLQAIGTTESSVVLAAAKSHDPDALVARFDGSSGAPSGRVRVAFGGDRLNGPIVLASKPSGETKIVAAGDVHEIVIVDVDDGTPPTTIGTRDSDLSWSIGAAFEPGGELLVGWDRVYDRCFQYVPYSALAAVVRDGVAEAPRILRDMPNHSEHAPAVSPSFMVWQQDDDLTGLTTKLVGATLDDLGTAYELGDQDANDYVPILAEESPGRAAIAWRTLKTPPQIAALVRDANGVRIGVRHEIPRVTEDAGLSLDSFVSVGDGRYLVTWTETTRSPAVARGYATVIDLSNDPAPRLAPPARTVPSTPRAMPRVVPCSH